MFLFCFATSFRDATSQEMARGKKFFTVREKSGNLCFESGKIDVLKKSQGKLK